MKIKKPVLIKVIRDLNIIIAFFIIISFFPTPKFIGQLGITTMPIHGALNFIIRISAVIGLLIITYGFLRLEKWGYWSLLTYYSILLVVSIISTVSHNKQLSSLFIPSLLMLNITFSSKRYFSQ